MAAKNNKGCLHDPGFPHHGNFSAGLLFIMCCVLLRFIVDTLRTIFRARAQQCFHHPWWKFGETWPEAFSIILLTDKQTNWTRLILQLAKGDNQHESSPTLQGPYWVFVNHYLPEQQPTLWGAKHLAAAVSHNNNTAPGTPQIAEDNLQLTTLSWIQFKERRDLLKTERMGCFWFKLCWPDISPH